MIEYIMISLLFERYHNDLWSNIKGFIIYISYQFIQYSGSIYV